MRLITISILAILAATLTFAQTPIIKQWVLTRSSIPIIAPNCGNSGQRVTTFSRDSLAREVLVLSSNNIYTRYTQNDTGVITETGTWTGMETDSVITFYKFINGKHDTYGSQWNVKKLTDTTLKLTCQTRAGFIYKDYELR